MQFRILGPLEVADDRCAVLLGGTKQRATLAYLLLHANRIVPTSQLVNALWAVDDAPISARKILQNAIWGLRRVLGKSPGPGAPTLVTQAPGYRLTVDPENVDLFRFQREVTAGRGQLTGGEPERAAHTLREVLKLWRGPVLADLVEAGIGWPELSTLQNMRWDAMEDLFEAELACGRHLAVLGELEAAVGGMALRERMSGQLMLALYRSGRQAEALEVYSRVRAALVEELGLEPGRELQTLQRAILEHDSSLMPPDQPTTPLIHHRSQHERPAEPQPPVQHEQSVQRESWVRSEPSGEPAQYQRPDGNQRSVQQQGPAQDERPVRPQQSVRGEAGGNQRGVGEGEREVSVQGTGERRSMSVLLLQTQLDAAAVGVDLVRADEMLEYVGLRLKEQVGRFGGTVSATIGSVSMALFETACSHDAAHRAVMASLAIRDERFDGAAPTAQGLSFRGAIVTGEALVRYGLADGRHGRQPVSISGTLLDRGHLLLSHADGGEIRVCDDTRKTTEAMVLYRPSGDTGEWAVQGVHMGAMGQAAMPIVEREFELELLDGLMARTRHRSTAHLVTILGESGTGKTRFLAEFERRHRDSCYLASVKEFTSSVEGEGTDSTAAAYDDLPPLQVVQRHLVNAICEIQPYGATGQAVDKLLGTLRRLVYDEARVNRLVECLVPYIDPGAGKPIHYDTEAEVSSWRQFLEQTVLDRPLILMVDDLHWADDEVLDFLDGLVDVVQVPVFVVASARPELLARRPEWGAGKRQLATITLDALSDAAVDELMHLLLSPERGEREGMSRWFRAQLRATVEERPDERRRYFRKLFSIGEPGPFGNGGRPARCATEDVPLVLEAPGRL